MWLRLGEPALVERDTLAMALEVYLYCPDTTEQDRDDLDELAEYP